MSGIFGVVSKNGCQEDLFYGTDYHSHMGTEFAGLAVYGLDENSLKYKKMVEWIAKDLGATTLKYQKLDDMVEAIGLPKGKVCLYCWTGKEP